MAILQMDCEAKRKEEVQDEKMLDGRLWFSSA